MTFNEIEKEFEKNLYSINNNGCADIPSAVGYFKQSFIKYLQSEVERLEKTLIRNEEFGFCKHCPFHKGDMEHDFEKCAGHDKAISDQITYLQTQIKELEV